MDDERVVRDCWESVDIQWGMIEDKRYGMAHCNGRAIPLHGYLTEAEIWQAARLFTEARKEEVRQIDEEIALQEWFRGENILDEDGVRIERTLQRLRDIRAGLVQGMRTGGGA